MRKITLGFLLQILESKDKQEISEAVIDKKKSQNEHQQECKLILVPEDCQSEDNKKTSSVPSKEKYKHQFKFLGL